MTRSKLVPAGFLVLALLGSGALVATAQSVPGDLDGGAEVRVEHRGGDRGGHGPRGHRGGFGGEMFRTVFEAVDADGDGSVTREEIDAYRAARLAEVDASGDGALSIDEFETLYRDFTRHRMVDAFQALDADGDGQISPDEIDTRVSRLVERLDRDGDGAVTLQRPGAAQRDN